MIQFPGHSVGSKVAKRFIFPLLIVTRQRWTESEKLTPKLDPALKTKNPDPTPKPVNLQIYDSESGSVPIFAMLLHTFY